MYFPHSQKVLEINILEGCGSHIQSVIQENVAIIVVHKTTLSSH